VLLIKFRPPATKKKNMPRSVQLLKEQKKKIMKQAKGFFGRRKTFGQLLRMR
jgi:ribosomal protein L20